MLPCRLFIGSTALVGVVLLTAAFASQDKGQAKPAAAPTGAPTAGMDPEMMAKWGAYAKPGAEHKVLEGMVGKWTAHVKMWMDPAAPPMESDGSAEVKSIMGNRFIEEEHKGTAMGAPFEGLGVSGYDNIKKKYVGSWIDNMGTGVMTSEGTWDAAKKTISYSTQCPDQSWTKYVPSRMVCTIVDDNSHKLEMFSPDKTGKEFRCMEITYTRAK